MSNKNTEEEKGVIQYFLYEKKIYNKLAPLFEDHITREPCVDECIIKNLSHDFSMDQLEMIIYLLEKEIKVKEFNRTFFVATLVAIFALLTVIFTLLSPFVKDNPIILVPIIALTIIVAIIGGYFYVNDKTYRITNKLLVFVSLAKKYKSNTQFFILSSGQPEDND